MKRHLVALPAADDGVELRPMKEWLRLHPSEVPPGQDATGSTSRQLRAGLKKLGWHMEEMEQQVVLIRPDDLAHAATIIDVLGADDEEDDQLDPGEQGFALEYQLRDFLADNLSTILVDGKRLSLYVDPTTKHEGIEFPTDVGRIDILAVDEDGTFVVFELKRASVADKAVGQLARYMGWVRHSFGNDTAVRGVIVAKSIDTRLRLAASVIPNVSLLEYTVQFDLQSASELPPLPPHT